MSDHHKIALEHMAADEAALRARGRALEQDVDAYRALAQQAIQALADLTKQRDRLREASHQLQDENRWLRSELMRCMGVATVTSIGVPPRAA